jgi:ureidoglycolate hydrolase
MSVRIKDYVMAEMIVSNYKEAELSEWTVVRSLAIAFKNAVTLLNLHPTDQSQFMPAYESAFGFLVTIRYYCQDKDRTDEFLANVTGVLVRYSSGQALKYFKETCHHAVEKIQHYEDNYYQFTPKKQLYEHMGFPCLNNNHV